MKARVGRNQSYIGHVRRALADLEAEFGNRLVRKFQVEEIRDYLFGLPYGAITIKNKRTYFQGAFGWWEQQGWLTENPMKRVESPQIQDKEPEILTVAETRALFRANEKIDPGSGSAATTAPIPKGVGKSAGSSRLERLPGCGPPPSPHCRCSCGKSLDKTTFLCSLNIIGGVRVSP